jgi:hypothetical protein
VSCIHCYSVTRCSITRYSKYFTSYSKLWRALCCMHTKEQEHEQRHQWLESLRSSLERYVYILLHTFQPHAFAADVITLVQSSMCLRLRACWRLLQFTNLYNTYFLVMSLCLCSCSCALLSHCRSPVSCWPMTLWATYTSHNTIDIKMLTRHTIQV